jgi:ribosomal protein L29
MSQSPKHKLEMPRINDINGMTNEELKDSLKTLRGTYMGDKGNTEKGNNPPVGRMRQVRITIARILTVMRQRGIVG